ncbi:diaminopimelate epimerase [Clostridium formicaceticum]|nr:hypothetical protein [Clostridium formicaceticum]ARE88754.1 diaminopimelate epimerase [Clostridium formicaceticum]
MTIFITDTLPRHLYKDIAKNIMKYNNLCAEQVGFIEKPSSENQAACMRLHMMGDEFCANATRALAALLVYRQHPEMKQSGENFIVPLEVSGSEDLIHCEVEITGEINRFISTASIPLHKGLHSFSIEFEKKILEGTLVEFPGILHLVIKDQGISDKEAFFQEVKRKLHPMEWEALGVMFYDEAASYMEPLVYVKATDSLFWERGCGSGTAAVGVALSHQKQQSVDMEIHQPGGSLQVMVTSSENKVTNILLKGSVKIVAEGFVYL